MAKIHGNCGHPGLGMAKVHGNILEASAARLFASPRKNGTTPLHAFTRIVRSEGLGGHGPGR
eukprot:9391246-Alexandrium_andersonii.AAC.1